ncbi:MAG: polyphosphate polymerase domain-containing protein [Pedosphaera sp.]|nr:polyphosphate polymerase domain-containing protein [Pedosphaera sp.]
MATDNLQQQRFELKYIVRETVAVNVREFVRSHLEVDEFGATRPNLSYPVHSLYLDSDQLDYYWQTINGNRNRYKLRIRYYDEKPESPVFFEIKRRMNDAILKQRGAVRRERVASLIAGHLPAPADLVKPASAKDLGALQRFNQLMLENRANPKAHVSYLREAWISPQNNAVRITMDRDICCESQPGIRFLTSMIRPTRVFDGQVVLELKFTGRFPDWFGELVRLFGLVQCSAAKYADGVVLLGERRLTGPSFESPTEAQTMENLAARREFLKRAAAGTFNLSFA